MMEVINILKAMMKRKIRISRTALTIRDADNAEGLEAGHLAEALCHTIVAPEIKDVHHDVPQGAYHDEGV